MHGAFETYYCYGRPSLIGETMDLVLSLIDWYLLRRAGMDQRDLQHICLIMDDLIRKLSVHWPAEPMETARLIHAAAKAACFLAYKIWPPSARKMAIAVEHLNQNSILDAKVKPIAEICGRPDWLWA